MDNDVRNVGRTRRALLWAAAAAVLALATACGGESPYASAPPAPVAPAPAPTAAADADADGGAALTGILATKDLGVGQNRVSFLLTSPRALIKVPTAEVTAVNLSNPGAAPETATAGFHLWPFGSRGNYAATLTFDQPGDWRLDVAVEEDGATSMARIPVTVANESATPSVGQPPPSGDNKTARDVGRLQELTTSSTPDPALYQQTVTEALASGDPVLVVFASPALCTSPTCGPQVETVEELEEQYRGRAAFIHVEVYDNPADIQGDLSRARYVPMVDEWGLSAQEGYLNESWVFIIGRDGTVASKYQGYASHQELTAGLDAVL